MQVFIENSAGRQALPAESGRHGLCLHDNRMLISLEKGEAVEVECNGEKHTLDSSGKYDFPILWDRSYKSVFAIKRKEGLLRYQFQLENVIMPPEEDIASLLKFVGQVESVFKTDQEYGIGSLFEAIKEDKISLIITKTPYSGYDDRQFMKKIAETIPMIMDICSHPKQSLRTEEAVLDVNLVKRINSRTLDHLASHSEHWKARTLNGLIPNRLRADIFEDEINIYENLFFRMAVDDILKYVHCQTVSLEKTIQQNDNAIDWNAYGKALYDYKRMRIFEQLLPDYDVEETKDKNQKFKKLLGEWRKLEKNFSTVEASQFYRSIDKKKHISRNIQLTNILKKDSRYHALYRLWCEIQRQIVQERQKAVSSDDFGAVDLSKCYSMYAAVLLLYVFKLLECRVEEHSVFRCRADGTMEINAVFQAENMRYRVTSGSNRYGTPDIEVTFVEKCGYEYKIPEEVRIFYEDIKEHLPDQAELDMDGGTITFYARPSMEKQKELKKLFRRNRTAQKGMGEDEIKAYEQADKVWQQELEELFMPGRLKGTRTQSIRVSPRYVYIEHSENAVGKFTDSVLSSAKDIVFYTFPLELGEYKKNVKSERLINRLLNYGEKYSAGDAEKFGDYRTGIIPVAQAEIGSAQRLMKLISVHSSRLQIQWNDNQVVCPVCGGRNCQKKQENGWKCRNKECGVMFGRTKHADGCGEDYEWIRPYETIRKEEVSVEDPLELMLRKETIFDRLTITDFEFEIQKDDSVKYIPICPKCGRRSLKK